MNTNTHAARSESASEPGNAPGTGQELVVHPHTGEVLDDLSTVPPERLADALVALRDRQAEVRRMESAIARELESRLATRQRKLWLVGEYELRLEQGNESVWDADELEVVLRRLVDEGVVSASECVGLISRDPVVSRSEAKRLLTRLDGPAAKAVKDCMTWQPKGRPRLTVTPSLPLIPE